MNNPQKEAAYRAWNEDVERVWYAHSHEQQLRWGRWHAELNQRRRRVDKELRKQVLERDRNTCRYCGTPLLREKGIHIDHVHPFSKDGETIIDNLVASCRECNKVKSYLHGIKPMALDKLPRWNSEDCKTALAKSTQRRKKLMREWENLALISGLLTQGKTGCIQVVEVEHDETPGCHSRARSTGRFRPGV